MVGILHGNWSLKILTVRIALLSHISLLLLRPELVHCAVPELQGEPKDIAEEKCRMAARKVRDNLIFF